MRKLCNYWSMFRLSITGRVIVSKTSILSQGIYLMGALLMLDEEGDIMNDILVDFVSGTDRPIERHRQFSSTELGGYGLIDTKALNNYIK